MKLRISSLKSSFLDFVFQGKRASVLKGQFLYYFEEVKGRMAVFGVSVA